MFLTHTLISLMRLEPNLQMTQKNVQFHIKNVAITEVCKMLCTLKLSKSGGHDEISVKLPRDVAEEITPPLTAIFNASV